MSRFRKSGPTGSPKPGSTRETVKLGIDAPQDVKVYRAEVYEEIMKANIEAPTAAGSVPPDLKMLEDLNRLARKKKGE